jgi:hypothetical protein
MARGSIISRLTGTGFAAALVALLLWPAAASYDAVLWPFLALLGVAALAGAAVLALTGIDLLLHPRRGGQVSPIRVFDIVSGAALVGFALLLLHWLGGFLPA